MNPDAKSSRRFAPWVGHAWGAAWRLLAVLVALYAITTISCGVIRMVNPPRKTYRFVFPEGAHGTFVLRCLVPGAPPLRFEDGFRLVRFEAGVQTVDTSDEYVFGNEWYVEEHFVEGRSGRTKVDGMYCRPAPSLEHVRVDVTCKLP